MGLFAERWQGVKAGMGGSLPLLPLVDGVNVCAVVGLAVHAAAPYGCGGGGDGVVLDDLLLRARRRRAPRRTALWTCERGGIGEVRWCPTQFSNNLCM